MINSLKCQLNESIDVIPMFSEYSIRLICGKILLIIIIICVQIVYSC